MSRNIGLVLVGVSAVLLLAATLWMAKHSPEFLPRNEEHQPREVVDMTSRTVRIPQRPTRILSLCTSATDAIVTLDAGDRLVAIDEFSRIVPGAERAAVVGKGGAISREKVVELGVDLAFVWWYQDDAAATLEDLGVPAVRIRSVRADELPNEIRLVGQCLGCSEAADRSATRISDFLALRKPAKSGNRVYIEMYGPLKTVGRRTYIGDLLELAGGQNVAGDAAEGVLLSAEKLIEADPDVILCVGQPADAAAFAARPGMDGLRAVRRGACGQWIAAGWLPDRISRSRWRRFARRSRRPASRRRHNRTKVEDMPFFKITHNPKHRFATLHNFGCTFRCRVCSYKLRSGADGVPGQSWPHPAEFLEHCEDERNSAVGGH